MRRAHDPHGCRHELPSRHGAVGAPLVRAAILGALALGLALAGCDAAEESIAAGASGAFAPGGAGGGSPEGGNGATAGSAGAGGSQPLGLTLPGPTTIGEDEHLRLEVGTSGGTGSARLWLTGLPPGARWDESSGELTFTPDFTQGGASWEVQVTARDATATIDGTFTIAVQDTIAPPWPTVVATEPHDGYTILTLEQQTDDYLDSPGYAGRVFAATVYVPDGATAVAPMPVRLYLHGLGGSPYSGASSGGQYRIYPHDPGNSYWWGYGELLPGAAPSSGTVPDYTARRALHLLEWVLHSYEGADPERVYVTGGSMGGAGALVIGLLYARHFAFVEATIGQTVARNHRPSRIAQLSGLWGAPALALPDGTALEEGVDPGVWDRQDLTRALAALPEARNQFVSTKHGKDDPTIHFGAVAQPSPLTGRSFYETLRAERIGHYVVWDEGGHGSADPVLGASWWDSGWSLVFDSASYLRRDRAFPAFTNASHDWEPGDGTGNGAQSWSDESGFAGEVATAGDTGWSGDLAGARNRFLRWDSNGVVDELDRVEIPLHVLDGAGSPAPAAGYPSTGDRFDRELPVVVDVTPRRTQRFRCLPGELVTWSFGEQSGSATADADGAVTVTGLELGTSPVTLVVRRAE